MGRDTDDQLQIHKVIILLESQGFTPAVAYTCKFGNFHCENISGLDKTMKIKHSYYFLQHIIGTLESTLWLKSVLKQGQGEEHGKNKRLLLLKKKQENKSISTNK